MSQYKNLLCLSVLLLAVTQSLQSPVAMSSESDNVDLNVDFGCIANAACATSVSSKVVKALNLRKSIDFGAFVIEPLPNAKTVEGRSLSKFWEFANGNSLRIPLGAYSLSLQKSEDYDNYFEVSVSKTVEGKELITISEKFSFEHLAKLFIIVIAQWEVCLGPHFALWSHFDDVNKFLLPKAPEN